MNLKFENSLVKVFNMLESFSKNLFAFADSVVDFVTTPIREVVYDFTNNELPLGSFFGAPIRLVADWLFPEDTTIIGFIFGVGIAIYLIWNIAVWISDLVT